MCVALLETRVVLELKIFWIAHHVAWSETLHNREKRLMLSVGDWVQVSKGLYSKALGVVWRIQEGGKVSVTIILCIQLPDRTQLKECADCDKLRARFPNRTFKVLSHNEFLFNDKCFVDGLHIIDIDHLQDV